VIIESQMKLASKNGMLDICIAINQITRSDYWITNEIGFRRWNAGIMEIDLVAKGD
jgi:hypothetical protein